MMLHVTNRQPLSSQFGAFTDPAVHAVVFLALLHSCRAQSEVIVPSQPVVSLVGEDVILPCHLDPVMNAFDMFLEWTRPDLNPRFILLWRQGEELETEKHPSFRGRTSVFIDELEKGNISLKLSKVKVSDEGGYKCVKYLVEVIIDCKYHTRPVKTSVRSSICPQKYETVFRHFRDFPQLIHVSRFILVWRQGEELETKKHPSFSGRTSVFIDELEKGNISLKLSKVKVSDEGGYKCFMPALSKPSTVQLVVGVVSSPVVQMTKNNNGVLLECESADWYPEPEMFWLDGEGNLLSAEPTETVRGPDGLYTVSSRVTVEKRHGRKFTCRVTQSKINQTREKHITIPDHFFVVPNPRTHVVIGAVIGCAAIIFVVWKWRQKKFKNKKRRREDGSEHSEEEKLVTSKSDETGFQVVNEKKEETNQEQEQGQRRETNDGDKNEQKTVKPVRDDSGLSIQIKHINPDQKIGREETQQEATSDIVQKERKTGKHSEEEKPVTSKADKTGFQVVEERLQLTSVQEQENNVDTTGEKSETEDEIVTEPEPVKDIVSAAAEREMKETDLPVIQKEEETNQDQEQGQRRETNDVDESEQETVKPVRDDSRLSIQIKHINTDQLIEREETQQEATSDEGKKETKNEKHSEEEKPVTSKSDKTGFHVVNEEEEERLQLISVQEKNNVDKTAEKSEPKDELVTEPEPVKDIVSAAAEREMKETDLPVILTEEETNQEQEQGQRQETNDGDKNEQKTVKPVRDDSGHSIQIKHINTDQKIEREETQQETVRDEDEKETKQEATSDEDEKETKQEVTSDEDKKQTKQGATSDEDKKKTQQGATSDEDKKETQQGATSDEDKQETQQEATSDEDKQETKEEATSDEDKKETQQGATSDADKKETKQGATSEEDKKETKQGATSEEDKKETQQGAPSDEDKQETKQGATSEEDKKETQQEETSDEDKKETKQEATSDEDKKETQQGATSDEDKQETKQGATSDEDKQETQQGATSDEDKKETQQGATSDEDKQETQQEATSDEDKQETKEEATSDEDKKETQQEATSDEDKKETQQEATSDEDKKETQQEATSDEDKQETKEEATSDEDKKETQQEAASDEDKKETQQEATSDEDKKETQQEATSDIVQKERKTGKHSEEEKPVTSKADKTGFQVVEERLQLTSVQEQENNADKTAEMKETDRPVIQKEEETNQEQEQGQRPETNDGDENEQNTVKPVRDDSGLSIQIKHINTDQKMEREETQQEAASDEDEKETKGITEEIKVEWKGGEKQESVTDKEADTYETQKKHKKITSESKEGEQQLMLQHSDMNKEMRERGLEGQEDLQQEEDMETYQPQPESATEGHKKEAFGRGQKEEQTQNIKTDQKMEKEEESVTDKEADTNETQKKHKKITSESKRGEQQLMLQHSDMNKEMRERGVEGQEDLQQEEDMETYQPQPNVIQSTEPLNTQEEGLHMDQQQRDDLRRNSEEGRMQIEASSEMLTQGHEEQNMNLIKEQQQQEEDMETD
ncbi:golgin subfamily A member 6-like protein 25 [Labrus bergylta]|uniref:golgin subfamily A member 6-like protein 25 n=1 Tax=Labrus bergylta TaxID=56723 RepID=UPI0033130C7A